MLKITRNKKVGTIKEPVKTYSYEDEIMDMISKSLDALPQDKVKIERAYEIAVDIEGNKFDSHVITVTQKEEI